MNKYHARKTVIDGITFDSASEASRYAELKMLEKHGEITDLRRQVPFILLDDYVISGKKKRGIKYVADFVYFEDGIEQIEDVKGCLTTVYKIKKKMFEARYGKTIEEINVRYKRNYERIVIRKN